MKSEYKLIENLSKAQFNGFAKSPAVKSHFLGSYEWGEVTNKTGSWKPYYIGVAKNDTLIATALLLQKPLLLGYSYFYIPRGFSMDYHNIEDVKAVTRCIHKFCKKHRAIYFKIDPDIKLHTIDIDGNVIDGEDNTALSEALRAIGYNQKPLNYFFENEQPRFTFRIPLTNTLEAIEAGYSRTTKARIKHARNNGVEVTIGTKDDIKEFCRLMAMTEKRQDFFSHDKDYYESFYDIFSENDMVTLYLGKINIPKLIDNLTADQKKLEDELDSLKDATSKKAVNRCKEIHKKMDALKKQLDGLSDKPKTEVIVSAYLTVNYDDKAWALYAANDMDYGKFYANYAVYERQIRDAKEKQLKVFDVFGTIGKTDSDSRLSGLYEFKKKWGGEFTEFIGEYDYIENKVMYWFYKTFIPFYHKLVNRKLRKKVQEYEG